MNNIFDILKNKVKIFKMLFKKNNRKIMIKKIRQNIICKNVSTT